MESIWQKYNHTEHFDRLDGDYKCDVAVIGGGITGILCAHSLRQAGVDVIVVEANDPLSATTCNTTAKITAQHGLIYSKIAKRYGDEASRLYYDAQAKAVEKYKSLAEKIPCDFEERASYVYSLSNKKRLENEIKILDRIGISADLIETLEIPLKTVGGIKVPAQAQFNPLKLLNALCSELSVYANTRVTEWNGSALMTEHGRIRCDNIVVATHFPIFNKHGGYFLKMYQQRSYVIALENAQKIDGMYVDESGTGLSFRGYRNLLLLGGGGHRTGKVGGNWRELGEFARECYPLAKEIARWATQDCMTLDAMPYIGQYSKNTPNLFVATGYNKWGMTSAMVAADVIRDILCHGQSKYEGIFSPSRTVLHSQLALNTGEALLGILSPRVPRCPHLGCALKYNKAEHSWDCSCHGSRFTNDGKLLDGPANGDTQL